MPRLRRFSADVVVCDADTDVSFKNDTAVASGPGRIESSPDTVAPPIFPGRLELSAVAAFRISLCSGESTFDLLSNRKIPFSKKFFERKSFKLYHPSLFMNREVE